MFILGFEKWFGDVPEFFFYSLAESIVLMLLFANSTELPDLKKVSKVR